MAKITNVSKTIWVRFQREGIHKYPEALTDPSLNTDDPKTDVSFLGYPHRHIFHFEVEVDVAGSNRDIEFIQFKRWLEGEYDNQVLELNNQSCEMIAEEMCGHVLDNYNNVNTVRVSVSEDNENGATVTEKRITSL